MDNFTERRKETPIILDEIREIKSDMDRIALNAEKVSTLVEERNTTALQWRDDVCKKFDAIFTKLDGLPCKIHIEKHKNRVFYDSLLWGAIAITFGLTIVALGWK